MAHLRAVVAGARCVADGLALCAVLNGAVAPGSGLLYYSAWGKPFVVINSHDVAVDLLERRSAIYADRWV